MSGPSCMSSEIFEIVAQDDVRFFVHMDILAHQSEPFKEAISGEWKESTDRKIILQDWDAETVCRLVQFLYTGDYQYVDHSSSDVPLSPVVEEQSLDEHELPPRALTSLQECIESVMPKRPNPRMTYSAWLESVDISTFNFGETLLAHAKVYALAHFKSIAALKALAQERLSKVLLRIHPLGYNNNRHLAMNIVNLATYVYGNTDSLSSSKEPLRNIISHFVALNFASLQTDSAAAEMMCNGEDFVRDFLAKLCGALGSGVGELPAPSGTRFITRICVS